ncbi:MAG: hypothetical protein JO091_08770 [Acidobacteriaceae bacterium]|nr:hypothetical protein [Acidobacteriaceae bacterium]
MSTSTQVTFRRPEPLLRLHVEDCIERFKRRKQTSDVVRLSRIEYIYIVREYGSAI